MSVLKSQLEITANAEGVEAGFAKAKRSINSFGTTVNSVNSTASKSIDRYIKKLEQQNAMHGMSARETELYKLSLRGASDAQLKAAESAIKLNESYERGAKIGQRLRVGIAAVAAASAAAAVASYAFINAQADQIANYQGLGEKIGDTAVAIASLQKASDVSGVSLDTVAAASVRLTSALSKTDDEGSAAGKAIGALGLNLAEFKKQSPVEQIDAVAKALDGFEDGAGKTAVMTALFGKAGAELIPIMNDLAGAYGRQTTLTEAQIKSADEYTKKLAALKSDFNALAMRVATAVIPALNDLIDSFSDGAEEADGLKSSADRLAGSSLADWFDSVAVNAAGFVDQMRAAVGIVDILRTSAALGAAKASADFNLLGKGSLFKSEATIKAEKEEQARRDAAVIEARKEKQAAEQRARDQVNNPLSKQVQARIDARKTKAAFGNPAASVEEFTNNLLGEKPKKTLNTAGLSTDKPDSGSGASSELRARLASDLAAIKTGTSLMVNAYDNAEKLLEAGRAADLINEGDYYEAKRNFISLNERAQIDALERENERIAAQGAIGKDKIEADRKIAENITKIAILRADASANVAILSIQEAAANKKIEESYISATKAAQSYVDTIAKQNAREIDGMGKGNQRREIDARRNQREDQFQSRRDGLDQDLRTGQLTQAEYDKHLAIQTAAHQRELANDEAYWKQKLAKQADWSVGASEALQNYFDDSQNIMAQTEQLFTNAFNGMEDALVDFVMTGKLSFKDLADSIVADIARIIIRQQITAPLANMLQTGMGSGGGLGGAISGFFGSLFGRAIGGPVSAGGMYEVNEKGRPELLQVAGKQYLMMGNQGGKVDANPQSGGSTTILHVNVTPPQNTSRATAKQWGADAGRSMQAAIRSNG